MYRKTHPARVVTNIKRNADKIWCAEKLIWLYWDATVSMSKTDETEEEEKKTKSMEVRGSSTHGSSQPAAVNDEHLAPFPHRLPQDVECTTSYVV